LLPCRNFLVCLSPRTRLHSSCNARVTSVVPTGSPQPQGG